MKKYIKKIKGAQTKLERAVQREINRQYEPGYSLADWLGELMQYGCQSGIVGKMIYYRDTLPFYKRHKVEINELLYSMLADCGLKNPAELFGEKWEPDDPLALDTLNQNLLAWFAFEETARKLAALNGIEV